MALYPRQNWTFAFHIHFPFYLCRPRFGIEVSQCNIVSVLAFVRKFRSKFSVKWYLYFFGAENRNGIEFYHLQNTDKFFAFSRHEAWHR